MIDQPPITKSIFKIFLYCFDDLIVYHPLLRSYVVSCTAEGPIREEYLKKLREEYHRDFHSYSLTWIEWELWQTSDVCGKCKFAHDAIGEGSFPDCIYDLLEGVINWLSGLRFELPVKYALKDLGYDLPITAKIFQHYWREFGEPDFYVPKAFVIECTRLPPQSKEDAERYIERRFRRFKDEVKVFVTLPLSKEAARTFQDNGVELIEYDDKDTLKLREITRERLSKLIPKLPTEVKGKELTAPEGIDQIAHRGMMYERVCAKVSDATWLFGIRIKNP
jgi:hypothetical protein